MRRPLAPQRRWLVLMCGMSDAAVSSWSLRRPPLFAGRVASSRVLWSSSSPGLGAEGLPTAREVFDKDLTQTRQKALDARLKTLGVDVPGLLEDRDSPALKCYRSYVYPRQATLGEARSVPLDKSSESAAQQIAFLDRRLRAAQADYVRNCDLAEQERKRRGLTLFPLTIVCDNIRSAYNVGSILRTAETAGVHEVIMCGVTPSPPHTKLSKTALSAEETVPTRHFDTTQQAIDTLKAEGFTLVAMETTSRSRSYVDVRFPPKTALVLGHEVTGVDTGLLESMDELVEIPTFGLKNSLNVASACSVVVFEVLRQWGKLTMLDASQSESGSAPHEGNSDAGAGGGAA